MGTPAGSGVEMPNLPDINKSINCGKDGRIGGTTIGPSIAKKAVKGVEELSFSCHRQEKAGADPSPECL